MTHSLLDGPALDRKLKAAIKNADQVKLAVAFWGRDASNRLGLKPKAKVICNLKSGGTNPDEIRKMLNDKIEVRQHNSLHAKIGCIGNEMSFVGSSNMSANGLGEEGGATKGWEESNIVFPNLEENVEKRFDSLWNSSKKITQKCLERAEESWRKRQQANNTVAASRHKSESFRQLLENDPNWAKANNIYIVVYLTPTEEDESVLGRAAASAVDKYGSKFDVYWDWADLPKDAYLINYHMSPKGSLTFDGIYKRHPDFRDFKEDGDWFQAAYLVKEIARTRLQKEDKADLRKAVSLCIRDKKACEEGSYCFPASDLVDYLGKN